MTTSPLPDIAAEITSASAGPYTLDGGVYAASYASGAWNSATVTLEALAYDGATYVPVATAWYANGWAGPLYLPPGQYKLALSGSPTDPIYVAVAPVPMGSAQ